MSQNIEQSNTDEINILVHYLKFLTNTYISHAHATCQARAPKSLFMNLWQFLKQNFVFADVLSDTQPRAMQGTLR